MVKKNVNLGLRETFADCGKTIAEYLDIKGLKNGTSFLKQISRM